MLHLYLQNKIFAHKRNLWNLGFLIVVIFTARLIGFAARVKIANILGKEQFGLFVWGLSLALYAIGIIRFGFDRTLVRDLLHHPEKTGVFIAASTLLRAILMAVVFLTLCFWKTFAGDNSDLSLSVILIILGTSILALDLQSYYDSRKEMWRHALFILIERLLFLISIFLWIYYAPANFSLQSVGIILIFSSLVCLGLQYKWAIPKIDFRTTWDNLYQTAVSLARQSFWVWLAVIGGSDFTALNHLFLKYYSGSSELGGYAACWQITAVGSLLIIQVARIGNQATAKITKPGVPRIQRVKFLFKYVFFMLSIVIPASFLIWLYPESILRSLFRPEYASDAPILRMMSVYLILLSLGIVASQYIISAKLEKAYLYNVLTGVIINIVCCMWFMPKYKGVGGAAALLISHGTTVALCWISAFRDIRRQPKHQHAK